MGIGVFLSLILFAAAPALASDNSVRDTLSLALGSQAEKVESTLLEKQFSARGKNSPEKKLRSGDIMIFVDSREPKKPEEIALTPQMPAAYDQGLQGFGHAAIIASDSRGVYRLESPADPGCQNEFRGGNSYIVLRPKAKVTGTPKRFQDAVDDLARSFSDIGYQYNPTFKTSIFSWTPEEKVAFRAQLQRYQAAPDGEKPKIPDMYCSELPITIHTLLGIMPRQSITMGDLIDIGLDAELKKGKSRIQVVNETVDGIVDSFEAGYGLMIEGYEAEKNESVAKNATSDEIKAFNEEIEGLKQTQHRISGLKADMKQMLMTKYGIKPEKLSCEEEVSGPLQSIADAVEKVLDKMKALPYQMILNRQIVRPVDFLKDSLTPEGNYEIVGYYPGTFPATTKCQND
jgi:hypothetical protein